MEKEWLEVLAPIFPYEYQEEKKEIYTLDSCITTKIYHSKERVTKPRVLVMAFPGTNCEYDSAKAFQDAGAEPHILVFRNLKPSYIEASI